MTDRHATSTELTLYTAEDGRTRIQCRFQDGSLWLTQAQMADLFQTTPQNVTLHLKAIFQEGELAEEATCKESLQVRRQGKRQVRRILCDDIAWAFRCNTHVEEAEVDGRKGHHGRRE
ncbi:MAG: hypothetical protein MUF54_12465, partial [Polyangiaceae bacterium]|nr:hypothetical protein [Polyangiaceae bacterium]